MNFFGTLHCEKIFSKLEGEIGWKPGDEGKLSEKTLTIRGIPLDFDKAKLSYFDPKIRATNLELGKPPYLLGEFKTNHLNYVTLSLGQSP